MRKMTALPSLLDLPGREPADGSISAPRRPECFGKVELSQCHRAAWQPVASGSFSCTSRRSLLRRREADPPHCCIHRGATSFELAVQLIPPAGLSLDTHDRNRYSDDIVYIASVTDKNNATIVNLIQPRGACSALICQLRQHKQN